MSFPSSRALATSPIYAATLSRPVGTTVALSASAPLRRASASSRSCWSCESLIVLPYLLFRVRGLLRHKPARVPSHLLFPVSPFADIGDRLWEAINRSV